MGATIYTCGYTGRTPADLLALADRHDALVIDIRYSPYSRVPRWRQGPLGALLGDRYRWCQAYGNREYRSAGVIRLSDPDSAAVRIGQYLATGRPVILLCACRDWRICHRRQAAEHLSAATGLPVAHL